MKSPIYHYDQPLVPEHLTTLTIEKIPLEEAYFIDPDECDTFESTPSIFVTEDRRLKMSQSHPIDMDDSACEVPMGRIAIMRVPLMDPEAGNVRDAYIADLRFIENYQLFDVTTTANSVQDQEEFMAYVAAMENAVQFDGFIAPEAEFDIDEDIPKGTFYGSPVLHSHLKKLRKRSDKVMRRFLEREATPDVAVNSSGAEKIKSHVPKLTFSNDSK